jgi:hypothetical protein
VGTNWRYLITELFIALPPALSGIACKAEHNQVSVQKSEEYKTPGAHVFSAEVPGSMLTAEPVKVDFGLDKTMLPGDVDKRQLGIVAGSVSLTSKWWK